jgi:type I restriction enzyme R subunit
VASIIERINFDCLFNLMLAIISLTAPVKFVNIAESIKSHPDFEKKYQNNPDPHNRTLAFEKMLKDIMLNRRKDELELYKLFANDPAFKASWQQSMERMIEQNPQV